jgi:hypothetical protein
LTAIKKFFIVLSILFLKINHAKKIAPPTRR